MQAYAAGACAGPDGFADSKRMSVFRAISWLVHLHNFLPVELVSFAVCGTSQSDGVVTSYSDPSWSLRHKAYDDMEPDQVRAAARAARQHNQEHGHMPDITCAAFAIIAQGNASLSTKLTKNLQRAAEASRKRKLDALRADSESDCVDHEEQEALDMLGAGDLLPDDEALCDADCGVPDVGSDDADFLDFLG